MWRIGSSSLLKYACAEAQKRRAGSSSITATITSSDTIVRLWWCRWKGKFPCSCGLWNDLGRVLSIACNMFHDRYPRRGYMISFDFATLNIICGELISQRQQNLKKFLHVPLIMRNVYMCPEVAMVIQIERVLHWFFVFVIRALFVMKTKGDRKEQGKKNSNYFKHSSC